MLIRSLIRIPVRTYSKLPRYRWEFSNEEVHEIANLCHEMYCYHGYRENYEVKSVNQAIRFISGIVHQVHNPTPNELKSELFNVDVSVIKSEHYFARDINEILDDLELKLMKGNIMIEEKE